MPEQQQPDDGLPQISIEDLLRMIGDRDVTIARQWTLIQQQAARLAELDKGNGKATDVTTTAFESAAQ
jgi:hypothetical protein